MVRINEILNQYNIGINALVEFLARQGLVVEPNPKAKISEEYLPLIHAQFGEEDIRDEANKVYPENIKKDRHQMAGFGIDDRFDWDLFCQEGEATSENKGSIKEINPLVDLTMNQKKVILQRIASCLGMNVIVSLRERKDSTAKEDSFY